MPDTPQRLDVLFVAGSARSGSTLLSSCLGAHPDAIFLGEVSNFWRTLSHNGTCSCGRSAQSCPFWSEVWERLQLRPGWRRGAREFSHSGQHRDLPRQLIFPGERDKVRRHLQLRAELYDCAREVSGRRVLIDSSKKPITAAMMSGDPRFQLRFLHLVRDPRSVVLSEQSSRARWPYLPPWERPQDQSAMKSAAVWTATNLGAELLQRRSDVRAAPRVHYEDFCLEPEQLLARIAEAVGMTAVEWPVNGDRVALPESHVINGNPMRMQSGSITITPDSDWRQRLSKIDRRITNAITAPLRQRYGYAA